MSFVKSCLVVAFRLVCGNVKRENWNDVRTAGHSSTGLMLTRDSSSRQSPPDLVRSGVCPAQFSSVSINKVIQVRNQSCI